MKHVLLIDDNEIDNYVNKLIVAKSKTANLITVMDSGIDALEFLTNLVNTGQPFPELIFLDIQMPGMDGFQFLEEYAKFSEEAKGNCIINMLTSSKNIHDIKMADECRYVKNFFNKPLKVEMLTKIQGTRN